MKTIILPGYSVHNQEWALEVKKSLSFKQSVLVHQWRHWQLGGTLHPKYEIAGILKEIGRDKVNIIAKSVGTMICMLILSEIPDKINKIILCGIPTVSAERLALFKEALKNFPAGNIVCFQNIRDPFAGYAEVKKFLSLVNPEIKIIKMPQSDHHYPYFAEFQKFLFDY